MKLIGGYRNTRLDGEDFALTPYFFLVYENGKILKVFGLGFCWGWFSVYAGFGKGVPKEYSGFKIYKKTTNETTTLHINSTIANRL